MGLSVGTMIAGWDETVREFMFQVFCFAFASLIASLLSCLSMGCRVLGCIMWTVKEGGSKEHGSLWDQVHHMLMVYWTAGVCLYPMFLCFCLMDVKASVS